MGPPQELAPPAPLWDSDYAQDSELQEPFLLLVSDDSEVPILLEEAHVSAQCSSTAPSPAKLANVGIETLETSYGECYEAPVLSRLGRPSCILGRGVKEHTIQHSYV